ncbi:tetrapyrrole methylase [Armillaria gallica]|uniref:Tetrapyrrole methylase n=1 Tax=Armillaria gallica TaxID=47427 RepID=A0A2H3CLH5_ARMGA|nr:tetrapyrrole methylase [Armillaria gallica]
MPANKGTLTIAGSGIASIGHITLETLSYIQGADKVYYVITDPATEAFIQDKSEGDCFDLTVYYDKNKIRYETYVQMCEVMLRDVRADYNVVGVFYGHPGVFVSPSHRAIAIARDEGYRARMLPGVSAEDYMFSDLGFDPAVPGCMTQEATAMLNHNKKLDPSIHNIIWQVGAVGIDTMVFDNRKFHLLVDRLEEDFGPDHRVVNYIGAVLPQSTTVMDEFTIGDLRKEDVVKQFTTVSTFYVPPRTRAPVDQEAMQKFGPSDAPLAHTVRHLYPPSKWAGTQTSVVPAYGPCERAAVDRIADYTPPPDHMILRASPAIRQFMTDLALNPGLRDRYKADPVAVLDATPDLSTQEKFALSFDKPGPVYTVMRATPAAIASGQEPTFDDIAGATESASPPLFVIT